MKPIQIGIHLTCDDEPKLKEFLKWDATFKDNFHLSKEDGDWKSNDWWDADDSGLGSYYSTLDYAKLVMNDCGIDEDAVYVDYRDVEPIIDKAD